MTKPTFKVGDRARIRLFEGVYAEVELVQYYPKKKETDLDGFFFYCADLPEFLRKGWAPSTHFEALE
jgi:hypothetical protein